MSSVRSLVIRRAAPFADPPSDHPLKTRLAVLTLKCAAHLHLAEGYAARAYMIDPGDLRRTTRGKADVAEARQLVMYVAHTKIGMTIAEIAEHYNRDRSTISYACREVEDRREDPAFDALVARIEDLVSIHRDPFLQGPAGRMQ